VKQRSGHRDDLALERSQLRELERVERVAEQVAPIRLDDDILEVVPARRVDEPEQACSVHVGLALLTAVQLGQHQLGGQPVLSHHVTVSSGPTRGAGCRSAPGAPTALPSSA